MKVLIIEDNDILRENIKKYFSLQWFTAHTHDAYTGSSYKIMTWWYDIIILDLGLGEGENDGLDICQEVRNKWNTLPILMLTARTLTSQKIEWLKAWADDYLTKPFALQELLARVAALGRRPPIQGEELTLSYADINMNIAERKVTRAGQTLDLLPKEYKILELFLRNQGRVVTRNMLLEKVWDIHFDPKTSVVETHISRLRNKLEKPFGDTILKTVRGAGYKLEVG